jgi:competence protein ComEC
VQLAPRICVACGLLTILIGVGSASAGPREPVSSKPLRVYFVDVEGGQATLFVTPSGQSLLVDTGWPGNNGRDADRIVAAAKDAGIHKVDFVAITHYHTDHVGGVPQLASRIPIQTFLDHGENREPDDAPTKEGWSAYQDLLRSGKYRHMSLKPAEVVPIDGMTARVVSSDGAVIHQRSSTEQSNQACKNAGTFASDTTENERSLGLLISFGRLNMLDLGDLTSDKELDLVCPSNQLGAVDVYIVSHHGWRESGSAVLLNSIMPRVAIMDNGAKKGGSPSAWDIIKHSPRLEDLWQLHFSDEGGTEHNVASEFIANLDGPDAGHYLKLTAWQDGSFEVFNARTGKTKHYAPR